MSMNGGGGAVAAASCPAPALFDQDEHFEPGSPTATTITDEDHIYTNVAEITALNNRPEPPTPDVTDKPRRNLNNGWLEYMTDTGRTYFFHSETGVSQWNPPRMRAPAQVEEFLRSTPEDSLASSLGCRSKSEEDDEDEEFDEVAEDSPVPPTRGDPTEYPPPPIEKDPWLRKTPPPPTPANNKASPSHTRSRSSGSGSKTVEELPLPAGSRMSVRLPASKSSTLPFQQVPPPSIGAVHVLPPVPPALPLPVGTPPSSTTAAYSPSALQHDYVNFEEFRDSPGETSNDSVMEIPRNDDTLMRRASLPKKVKSGTVEKCDGEAKKREWTSVFLYLTPTHLLIYKDEKSAEKHGKHYDLPMGVCELRGASASYVPEKEKKKKRVIQLFICNGPVIWLRTSNDKETQEWLETLQDVTTAQLNQVSGMPNSATTSNFSVATPNVTLTRHPSAVTAGSRPLSAAPTFGRTTRTASTKHKTDPMSSSAYIVSSGDPHEETPPSRESIITRLKRFFRTRPTVETLKEKGIYKPEPVFGSTLAAICKTEQSIVPKFILKVTKLIESKGLDVDGLYRVSGNLSAVQKIRCQIDQERYSALESEDDVHVLTGALKLFFRELADPIFPYCMSKDFLSAIQIPNASKRQKRFEELLNKLAPENRETLRCLLTHLVLVANHASQNRMQVHNLAIVIGPALFGSGEDTKLKKKADTGTNRKKKKEKEEEKVVVQSNSHLAFDMIMQGQAVEYLLKEKEKFDCLRTIAE